MTDIPYIFLGALIFTAFVTSLCIAYLKGWLFDGGVIKHQDLESKKRRKAEKQVRIQIRKMIKAEMEIKRLAVMVTSGTEEDPTQYIRRVQNMLFPNGIQLTEQSILGENSDNLDDLVPVQSPIELHGFVHPHMTNYNYPLSIDDFEIELEEISRSDQDGNQCTTFTSDEMPPSYEDCVKGISEYSCV